MTATDATLRFLGHVQGPGGALVSTLLDELGVSRRTLRRYVNHLRAGGYILELQGQGSTARLVLLGEAPAPTVVKGAPPSPHRQALVEAIRRARRAGAVASAEKAEAFQTLGRELRALLLAADQAAVELR